MQLEGKSLKNIGASTGYVLLCILCPVREGVAFLLLLFSAAMYAVDGGPFKSGHPLCSFLLY